MDDRRIVAPSDELDLFDEGVTPDFVYRWAHADLSAMLLDGANCEGINLFGARLVRTSFCRANLRNAELSFSDATQANFRGANLDGCMMYRGEATLAQFDDATLSETSDIPGLRVVALKPVS